MLRAVVTPVHVGAMLLAFLSIFPDSSIASPDSLPASRLKSRVPQLMRSMLNNGYAKALLLVRHGQSGAQAREVGDEVNPPLSSRGRTQAQNLRATLAEVTPDLVVVSPLERATSTWDLSNLRAPRIQFDSRLIESNWGDRDYYAHCSRAMPHPTPMPDTQQAWLTPAHERAASFLDAMRGDDASAIVAFGHWAIFGCVAGAAGNQPVHSGRPHIMMDNTGLSLLGLDAKDRWIVKVWNDINHVPDELL